MRTDADAAYEDLTLELNWFYELLYAKKNPSPNMTVYAVEKLSSELRKLKIESDVDRISDLVKSKAAFRNAKQIQLILSEISKKIDEAHSGKTANSEKFIKLLSSIIW